MKKTVLIVIVTVAVCFIINRCAMIVVSMGMWK